MRQRLAFTAVIALCALVLGSCQDAPTSAPDPPLLEIKDAVHSSGNPHFFFLPPMVPDPSAEFTDAPFDGSLEPAVEICAEDGGSCAAVQPDGFPIEFTMLTGPGSETIRVVPEDEHYIVNWHTDEFGLDPATTYRIRVSVADTELGYADVEVVGSGRELKNVDTDEFIPLLDGRTLPIKFRIEEGATPRQYLAYVTHYAGPVAVFRTPANSLVTTVPVGAGPGYIAPTPDNAFLYVTNINSGDVSVIETASNTEVARIVVGGRPVGIAMTPDGAHAFLGHQWSSLVHVIETATNTVVKAIDVGGGTLVMAIGLDGTYGYASHDTGYRVSLIDIATQAFVGYLTVGYRPRGIAFTPDGAFMYVTNVAAHTVSVVETATHTVVKTIPVGQIPQSVKVTPDGAFAYVTNSTGAYIPGSISVIETTNNTVVATIPVDPHPYELEITPDGTLIYVTHLTPGTISVIDVSSNTVLTTFPTVSAPLDIALIPAPPLP